MEPVGDEGDEKEVQRYHFNPSRYQEGKHKGQPPEWVVSRVKKRTKRKDSEDCLELKLAAVLARRPQRQQP